MPTISVIIPAYNQGRYLDAAIRSVLAQTQRDFEAIIVDDGSTDDTPQVAARFGDERIRYIRQDNRGLSAARNTGIRNSSGAHLTFLDSDDLFFPVKLQALLNQFEHQPDLGLVAGQAIPFDEYGHMPEKIYAASPPQNGAHLLLGNPLHVGSVLLRRSAQEAVGYFDETLRSYEDWDMWLRLARAGCRMGWVAQPVSLYRFHSAQMTRHGAQMTTATFAVLDKVFADPTLPDDWKALREQAYANAYLRAAAQAYHAQDCAYGKECLARAVQLHPELLKNKGEALVRRFAAWANYPKTRSPLRHLEYIYNNLPDTLRPLDSKRRMELYTMALQVAFNRYSRGDYISTRSAIAAAFRYQPLCLFNRGAFSLYVRSWLHAFASR